MGKFAAFFAGLGPRVYLIGGIILVIVLALTLAYCSGRDDGKDAINQQIDKANTKALERNAAAGEKATADREAEHTKQLEVKKELVDAVNKTPDTLPDPARIALGCERLRRQGTDTAIIPACR
jgi:hypothetical protein